MTLTCQHCHKQFVARESAPYAEDNSDGSSIFTKFQELEATLEESGILARKGNEVVK